MSAQFDDGAAAALQARIDAVFAGRVQAMPGDGRPTGMFKQPVSTPVRIGRHGLDRDEQADRRVHGGPEKAVHHYPARNYARLAARFPDIAAQLVPGCLGENLSTADWDESSVCIGDVFRAGSVVLQLSQPRSPCWKIDARHGVEELSLHIALEGLAGWYYRVLEPGELQAGDRIVLVARNADPVSLREYWTLQNAHRPPADAVRRVAETPGLAADKRERWRRRADWLANAAASAQQGP